MKLIKIIMIMLKNAHDLTSACRGDVIICDHDQSMHAMCHSNQKEQARSHFPERSCPGSRSGTSVLCTWLALGMKPQRRTSAKFILLRAPMIRAPIIATNIKA
jgi:hypothetical protein